MVLFLILDSSTEAESAPSFFTQDKKFGTKGSLLLKNFDVFQKEQLPDGSILLAGGTYPSSLNSIDLIISFLKFLTTILLKKSPLYISSLILFIVGFELPSLL